MNNLFSFNSLGILTLMILCHLLADFPLQGILGNLKQKAYWKVITNDSLYNYDWIPSLIGHSTMWAIITFLPLFIYELKFSYFNKSPLLFLIILIHIIIHAWVDNLKANKHKINLCTDQICHLVEIITTWVMYFIFI